MRWVVFGNIGRKRLQYRELIPSVDASGAFCPPGVLSEWKDVPMVDCETLSYEDLAASGGLAALP